MHILKTAVEDEEPSRSPEDERVQRPRVPLGAQRNRGGKREGWRWKMDVCSGLVPYGTHPGSNNPGSGSQIPLVWPISRKTRELTTSQHLLFLLGRPLPFFFCITFHFHLGTFQSEVQGTFVWQSPVFVALTIAVWSSAWLVDLIKMDSRRQRGLEIGRCKDGWRQRGLKSKLVIVLYSITTDKF